MVLEGRSYVIVMFVLTQALEGILRWKSWGFQNFHITTDSFNQGWRSRGPASVSRPASGPSFNGLGLGLGLGCPCLGLGLGLGGPGFVYRVSRTGLGLEAGLEA